MREITIQISTADCRAMAEGRQGALPLTINEAGYEPLRIVIKPYGPAIGESKLQRRRRG